MPLLGKNPAQFRTIRIPGDGRCLFRSVVHGAYIRAGKQSPSEILQKELADELREKVADEFIKRRAETECFQELFIAQMLEKSYHLITPYFNRFLEGDFDTYVLQMRQPHIWGGEPELLMCSHVLELPITVYMKEKNSGTLKIIAEYGQEYGRENPIRVLYHGYGHYDALPGPTGKIQSKLFRRR